MPSYNYGDVGNKGQINGTKVDIFGILLNPYKRII